MKFKKQIVIAIFVSLLLTSCSVNLKAGIIKHEGENERIEENIKKTEEVIKEAEEIFKKEEKISEEEKNELVVKVKNEFKDLIAELSETTDEIKIKELLKDGFDNSNENIENVENVYFATEKGEFYLCPEQELVEGFNPTSREWYMVTKEKGEYLESYIDFVTEEEVLTVSFSVQSREDFIGVLGFDIKLENKKQ